MKVQGLDSACLAETVEMVRSLFLIQTQPEAASQATESLAFGSVFLFKCTFLLRNHYLAATIEPNRSHVLALEIFESLLNPELMWIVLVHESGYQWSYLGTRSTWHTTMGEVSWHHVSCTIGEV